MLTYTTYSEAGGPGKTTLSANLARAHADEGLDTLVVDLDQQDGSLTYLYGVDDDRDNPDADTLAHHLIGKGKGDFRDLIRTSEGVDIIPSHNMLQNLGNLLTRAGQNAEDLGETFSKYSRLRHVLAKNDIPSEYDVLVVDPPGAAGPHLYNGLDATRNLVIPVEVTGKGEQSIAGLEAVADGLADSAGIDSLGVLAAVPNKYEGTTDQAEYLGRVDGKAYANPVTIRKRSSLLEGCWKEQCSAFRYVAEYREYPPDREVETLERFRELARFLEREVGV